MVVGYHHFRKPPDGDLMANESHDRNKSPFKQQVVRESLRFGNGSAIYFSEQAKVASQKH